MDLGLVEASGLKRMSHMIYETLMTVHVLSIVVWIGGMVFAQFFLRPGTAQLEAPVRLRLMYDVLGRFFKTVLFASLLTLATGVWMLGRVAKQVVQSGGNFEMPWTWGVMAGLGLVMVAMFLYIRFTLFKRLGQAMALSEWGAGLAALARIQTWVSVSLALGVVVLLAALMPWPV